MTNEERVAKFKNHNIVINCQTFEEAKEFMKWCYENDIKWYDGTYKVPWRDEKICYGYDQDNCLVRGDREYYSQTYYEIITYRDFFKEDKITNIQLLLDSITAEEECDDTLCVLLYKLKHKEDCVVGNADGCDECEFNKMSSCLEYLKEEHDTPNKITKFEYDLLNIGKNFDPASFKIPMKDNVYFVGLKEKGYLKNIDLKMTAKEILDNYEIIEE